MLELELATQFKRDLKKIAKQEKIEIKKLGRKRLKMNDLSKLFFIGGG